MGGRGSSRGGSALPRSSVRAALGGGARPATLILNLRPSLVVSSGSLGSSGSPGIGLMHSGYSWRPYTTGGRTRSLLPLRNLWLHIAEALHGSGPDRTRDPDRGARRGRVGRH